MSFSVYEPVEIKVNEHNESVYSRLDYFVSGTYAAGGGMKLAAGAGSKENMLPGISTSIKSLDVFRHARNGRAAEELMCSSAGGAFVFEGMRVPAEIFPENRVIDSSDNYTSEQAQDDIIVYGAGTGIEYRLKGNIYMRTGFDFASGGIASYVKNGDLPESSWRAYNRYGISMGAGHYSDTFSLNFNIRYGAVFSPPVSGEESYIESETKIISDFKIYI